MDAAGALRICNFHLVYQLPCERCAGGLALRKPNDFAYTTTSVQIKLTALYQVELNAISYVLDIIVTLMKLLD